MKIHQAFSFGQTSVVLGAAKPAKRWNLAGTGFLHRTSRRDLVSLRSDS